MMVHSFFLDKRSHAKLMTVLVSSPKMRWTTVLIAALCLPFMPANALGFFRTPASPVHRTFPSREPRWGMLADGSSETKELKGGVANWLSHAMLRVPDVNATVNYWLDRGAILSSYRKSGGSETAFITMGNGHGEDEDAFRRCFSLELTKLPDDDEIRMGNAVSYFGLSMLLEFQENLIGAAAGEKPKKRSREENLDPNGFELRTGETFVLRPSDHLRNELTHVGVR
mmetsp:Transcript_39504/g.118580  ORF Transcript_39504/g.118580 Transcript_39504/m.118580 type:complete len:227 (-) Transcript_39504:795-1475(-)